MSFQASGYARQVCETDADLTPAARFVLYVLGERASHRTGIVYAGAWLADVTGYTRNTVRLARHELVEKGYIGLVEERVGRPSVYRFACHSKLSTTPIVRMGVAASTPILSARDPHCQNAHPHSDKPRTGIPTGEVNRDGRSDASGQFHPAICGCDECIQLRRAQ